MITFEQAKVIQDRLLWDDVFDPYRNKIIGSTGPEILGGLEAIFAEMANPKLVILPWDIASTLMAHTNAMFHAETPLQHFKRIRDMDPAVYGYIATYRGVDVLANCWAHAVYVTSAGDIRKSDGGNTLFLNLKDAS